MPSMVEYAWKSTSTSAAYLAYKDFLKLSRKVPTILFDIEIIKHGTYSASFWISFEFSKTARKYKSFESPPQFWNPAVVH